MNARAPKCRLTCAGTSDARASGRPQNEWPADTEQSAPTQTEPLGRALDPFGRTARRVGVARRARGRAARAHATRPKGAPYKQAESFGVAAAAAAAWQ